MNKIFEAVARKWLKENLMKCNEKQQRVFRVLYDVKGGEVLRKTINDIVDSLPEDKLDHIMQQVQRTIEKNEKQSHYSIEDHFVGTEESVQDPAWEQGELEWEC